MLDNYKVNYLSEAVKDPDDLTSAGKQRWMNAEERSVIRNLEKYLLDDGQGHKHGKYAELLREFDITFVDGNVNPDFTAAVRFDTHMIYISTGFIIRDPKLHEKMFAQLSVLIRHEMAHVLMKHQIRMIAEWNRRHNEDVQKRLSCSASLHDLNNIIADFEISNKRYSSYDKSIVETMTLNNNVIGGLITEKFRNTWQNMSIEEMYEALLKEIDTLQQALVKYRQAFPNVSTDKFMNDKSIDHFYKMLYHSGPTQDGIGTFDYVRAANTVTSIKDAGELLEQANAGKLADNFSEIIKAIVPEFTNTNYSESDLKTKLDEIVNSSPTEFADVLSDDGEVLTVLYTPEDKFLAVELLKSIIDDKTAYQRWYDEVRKVLNTNKYSEQDLQTILDGISK